MLRAVLFDLDGTLVDRDAASERWFRGELERRADLVAPPGRAAALARFLDLDARGAADRGQFCRDVVQAFPGLAESPAAFWSEFTRGLAANVQAEPEALRLVDGLGARLPVAILTNGSTRNQRAKLAASGLGHVRAFVSEEIGLEKPEPGAFAHVLDALGVGPEGALFVGDDPVRDVEGARGAGLRTCWVSRGRAWTESGFRPDLTVERVRELLGREELGS